MDSRLEIALRDAMALAREHDGNAWQALGAVTGIEADEFLALAEVYENSNRAPDSLRIEAPAALFMGILLGLKLRRN